MILTYYTPYATLATLQQREQSGACSSYVERRQCRHCQRCNVFCWYPWRNQKKVLSLHLDFERGKEVPIYK